MQHDQICVLKKAHSVVTWTAVWKGAGETREAQEGRRYNDTLEKWWGLYLTSAVKRRPSLAGGGGSAVGTACSPAYLLFISCGSWASHSTHLSLRLLGCETGEFMGKIYTTCFNWVPGPLLLLDLPDPAKGLPDRLIRESSHFMLGHWGYFIFLQTRLCSMPLVIFNGAKT